VLAALAPNSELTASVTSGAARLLIGSPGRSSGDLSPGGGLGGRDRAVHGDRSREVHQAAGAAEARPGRARERDVGVLVDGRREGSWLKRDPRRLIEA